jgi:AmiR/NasT family two-component response regulator
VISLDERVDAALTEARRLREQWSARSGRSVVGRAAEVRAEAARLRHIAEGLRLERARVAAEVERLTSLADQLETALETRGTIERAKGILMVTRRCSADEAFVLLRKQSQHDNVKLSTIAQKVVASIEQALHTKAVVGSSHR